MSNGAYIQTGDSVTGFDILLSRPQNKHANTNVGLKQLDSINDVHFDRSLITYTASLLQNDSALTSLSTHVVSSNSGYAFSIGQLLLNRNIIKEFPITVTSTSTAFLFIFKGSPTTNDVLDDGLLKLGEIGIIAVKKQKYGDFIRANSFTAVTNHGTMFKDACSASKLHGIVIKTSTADTSWTNAVSSGLIFYDVGIVSIHGESVTAIDSVSSLSSVKYNSTIGIQTLTVFCSVDTHELNYTSNDSAFYDSYVTADPNFDSSTSNFNYTASGFQWGLSSASASHSVYYLRDFQSRNPYITTIGLYSNDNELLLVSKLTQPIKKPKNVPLTFKVVYDF